MNPTLGAALEIETSRKTTFAIGNNRLETSRSITEPPPSAITPSWFSIKSITAALSISLNAGSPSVMKISEILFPLFSSTTLSLSRKFNESFLARAFPTEVFPAPGGPMRIIGGTPYFTFIEERKLSRFLLLSPRESPPNFSSIASAKTRATIASATMPAAGTAHTSDL